MRILFITSKVEGDFITATHLVLKFSQIKNYLLTVTFEHFLLSSFYCWLWISKCLVSKVYATKTSWLWTSLRTMKFNLRLTLKIKRMSVLTFPWLYLVAKTVNNVVTKLLDLFCCWSVIICTKFGRQTKNRSKLNINYCRISVSSQLIFTCSKSTIETVEKGVNV